MFLISSYSCLCSIHWRQVLSREWRCSWSMPTGATSTTSEWSRILLPSKVWLILEILWYMQKNFCMPVSITAFKPVPIVQFHKCSGYIFFQIENGCLCQHSVVPPASSQYQPNSGWLYFFTSVTLLLTIFVGNWGGQGNSCTYIFLIPILINFNTIYTWLQILI